jgi:hypothetical protein
MVVKGLNVGPSVSVLDHGNYRSNDTVISGDLSLKPRVGPNGQDLRFSELGGRVTLASLICPVLNAIR